MLHEPAHAAAALDGSRLELDLAGALAGGQMHLVYQPYIDLADGTVAGFETLLRWRHPPRGELQPGRLHPAAEATGLILPLGDWALGTALAAAARWPARLALAVNISPLQFHQPGFVARHRRGAGRDRRAARPARARDHRDRADARQPRDHRGSSGR